MKNSLRTNTSDFIIELRYRRTVFIIFYLIVFLCMLSLAFIVRLNILQLAENEWYLVAFKLILAASLPLTVLLRATLFFAPRLFSSYKADSSKLLITRAHKSREVFYEQIDCLVFSKLSPRFFGGFRFRLKSGAWFRFPTLMEKSDRLLLLIKKARSDLKSEADYEKLLHSLELIDVSWERIRDKFSQWKHNLIKYLAFAAGVSFFYHYRGLLASIEENAVYNYLIWFFLISFCHFVFAMILNHFEEKWNNSHLLRLHVQAQAQGHEPPHRDKHYESRAEMLANIIFYSLTLLTHLFVLFKDSL